MPKSKNPRILVIDDEEVIRNLLSDVLTEKEFDVDTAETGEKGLEAAEKTSYDVILLDLRMPGADGITVMKKIREQDSDVVIIVITGYGSMETAQQAMRLGAYDYVTKPFKVDEVESIIRKGVDTARLTRTNRQLMALLETQNIELDRKVRERTKQLQLLYNIGKEISSKLELEEVLNNIVARISETLEVEICSLLLIDEQTKELTIRSSRGIREGVAEKASIKMGEDISGWVAQNENSVLSGQIESDPRFAQPKQETYYKGPLLSVPITEKGRVTGVINVNNKRSGEEFTQEDLNLLMEIATEAGIAIENARLYRSLQDLYLRTVTSLVSAIDAKDHYTRKHSESVSKYASLIAKEMNLPPQEIETVRLAGQLHDIGKIGIQEDILTKPGKLTEKEWEEMKKHSEKAAEILGPLSFLSEVTKIVRQNHERYDGKGYPDGLKGEQITLGGRIVAVADAYDTMISRRPYRKRPFTKAEVTRELEKNKGVQFDPKVVDAFLKLLREGKIK